MSPQEPDAPTVTVPAKPVIEHHDGGVIETIKTVIYAVVIAFAVRTFLFEPFNIPSSSMKPTLLIGDYLFVSKFSYGYSALSTAYGAPLFQGRVWGEMPRRGDVVVFKLPSDDKTDYIKRVVGLPGDRVQVIGGHLHLNGQEVPRRLIEPYQGFENGQERVFTQYIEMLPSSIPGEPPVEHHIIEQSDDHPLDNTIEFVVEPGHVFVMGDNRDNSQDSRVTDKVGQVPFENLVGRADVMFFSIEEGAHAWQLWKWPVAVRWSRLFHGID